MWSIHWSSRYWAGRYWPRPGGSASATTGNCGKYGNGELYGDGHLYCSSTSRRGAFEVQYDSVLHYLSVRVQATGIFVLDSILPLVRIKKI